VEALGGRSEAELRREPWARVFAQAPEFAAVWEQLRVAARGPYRFEAVLLRGDGAPIPVGVSASLLRRGPAEPMGVICSFQDLTEIKRMEARIQQADRLAAIGRLAAGLAHEIRNPIASIRGSIEVLRQSLRPEGADRRLMEIILRESDRLDGTIAEFLEFSRPRRLAPVLTDLTVMIDEVLLLLAHQAPEGLQIVKAYPDGTVKAYVDPAQLRQALWNLGRNAVEAMPRGGCLRVEARVRREGSRGRAVAEIAVEDTGGGVPLEHLPHIFEPFYTTKPDGTGLGLAIVHRIVEEHEGEIRVETGAQGARFVVTLPGVEA
jgi:two-component system sensor histidine kinase PilS (NtrC family)